ncbi:MAG: discoidin domain-containing protein, partial [Bacteroidales bacterium]|nr:discoidin domain-containing protein [Bacteroidales bacterium]
KKAHINASNYRQKHKKTNPFVFECQNEVPSYHNISNDCYDTYWATNDSVTTAWVEFKFNEPQTFNRVMLQEYIPLGQRVEKFHIEIEDENGNWRTIAEETTIGYKRIVLTETVTTKKVRIVIDQSRACIVLNRVGLFMDNVFKGEL